ncbi:MAG: tail protein X [Rhodoblastus sp.]
MTIDEPLRLDILAHDTMGTEQKGCFEALLAANPGLADQGPFALAPQTIVVPEAPTIAATPAVNPWE